MVNKSHSSLVVPVFQPKYSAMPAQIPASHLSLDRINRLSAIFFKCERLEKFGVLTCQFAQKKVCKTAGAETEPFVGQPLISEYFLDDGVVD